MRRAGVYASVLAGVVVVAGCGGDGGEAVPETSVVATAAPSSSVDPDAGIWDPCSLPDSAISASGLDPATKLPDVGGIDFDGWQVCAWRGATNWYQLTIYSGTPTLEDVRKRDDYTSFTDIMVQGRPAIRFLDADDTRNANCSVAIQRERGIVMFSLVSRPTTGPQGNPCEEVQQHADSLTGYLPGA